MGEQRPVRSVRSLVKAYVAMRDGQDRFWSTRGHSQRDYELRSYIVPRSSVAGEGGPQVDFLEGYWAPQVEGTRIRHVGRWAAHLVRRAPWRMPARVQWLWYVVVGLGLVGATAVTWAYLNREDLSWYTAVVAVVAGVLLPTLGAKVTGSLGDAARYFDDHPANVAVRTRVRDSVVRLLEDLHTDGRYDRIVVVGHSLGSAVAYDALRLLWARRMADVDLGVLDDLEVAQAAEDLCTWAAKGTSPPRKAGDLRPAPGSEEEALRAFETARSTLFEELAGIDDRQGHPAWLVSDFVSVGAAVAHVELLLSPPGTTCEELVRERELPLCPPLPASPEPGLAEPGEPELTTPTFRFARHPTRSCPALWRSQFHHGAMFAVTRWTNVYTTGDFVGGPLRTNRTCSPQHWAGVNNIRLTAWRSDCLNRRGPRPPEDCRKVGWRAALPILSHSHYWKTARWLGNRRSVEGFVDILHRAVNGLPLKTPRQDTDAGGGSHA